MQLRARYFGQLHLASQFFRRLSLPRSLISSLPFSICSPTKRPQISSSAPISRRSPTTFAVPLISAQERSRLPNRPFCEVSSLHTYLRRASEDLSRSQGRDPSVGAMYRDLSRLKQEIFCLIFYFLRHFSSHHYLFHVALGGFLFLWLSADLPRSGRRLMMLSGELKTCSFSDGGQTVSCIFPEDHPLPIETIPFHGKSSLLFSSPPFLIVLDFFFAIYDSGTFFNIFSGVPSIRLTCFRRQR